MNSMTQDLKNSLAHTHTRLVKQIAQELGFDFCGISKADFLENEAVRLETWLNQGRHGQMNYMANHFDMRLDPRLLVPDAQSVICLAYNYFPTTALNQNPEDLKIAKYAYGQDYHKIIKAKLKFMLQLLEEKLDFRINGRVFTDSAPILEKAWAQKSGLGWIGKNSNLISRKQGSFMFLAEIISDLPLQPDSPIGDYCGTCTRCIDACPTQAITEPYSVDGSRCISYFTIELKDALPNEMKSKFENWMFGCDICQDVCPWNRFSKAHQEPAFEPTDALLGMKKQDWIEITEAVFDQIFDKSAIKRTGYKGLKRNIEFLDERDLG